MSMISTLISPLPRPAIQAMLGLHVAGPIVPPPVAGDPFTVTFGDGQVVIVPQSSPDPANFTVTFGDGSLSIAV